MQIERPNQPRLVRAFNAAAHVLCGSGAPFLDLDPAALIDTARRKTGLSDFGDGNFEAPLRLLLRAYNDEAALNMVGRIAAYHETLHLLSNRLYLTDARRRYPEIADQVIRRPLFVTGLPRSGTTLLHSLLAQDPANRAPATWEVLYPSPPPARGTRSADRRIAATERKLGWLNWLAPGFKKIHPLGARLPQECIAITSHSFLSPQFHLMYRIPSYERWLDLQNLAPAYRFHKRFLQHLQSSDVPRQWVLKAPAHLFHLDALFSIYPDAGVIQTHRDPLEVIPSLTSLDVTLQSVFSDRGTPHAIARESAQRWSDGLNLVQQFRRTHTHLGGSFCDVYYQDLVHDPIGTIRRIYAHFDRPLSAVAKHRMQEFLAVHPKDRHGPHRYSMEQFGLRAADEAMRFCSYRQRHRFAAETP